eukprot:scaffold1830_cov117-Cylindrotheca_fusiformis.AAC.10
MKAVFCALLLSPISAFHVPRQSSPVRALVLPPPSPWALRSTQEKESSPGTESGPESNGTSFYLEGKSNFGSDKPASSFILGSTFFVKQSKEIIKEGLAKVGITGKDYIPPEESLPLCLGLRLSNEAVKEAERKREERDGRVETNVVSRTLYDVGCLFLDKFFDERPIARFWFLEIIARIPYFTYVSMLHLYESFGWWRGIQLRKVHNAQDDNELHHLLIMESLGGDDIWKDRFLGYHVAFGYYWILCAVYLFSPAVAYEFMELLESHAVDTYGTFLKENKDKLMQLPPPTVARKYYTSADLYLFDEFQVSKNIGTRRPPCDSLYDVFKNICDDEAEHVKTMVACQDYARLGELVVSPHAVLEDTPGEMDMDQKRKNWKEWAQSVNEMSSYESSEGASDFE